MRCRNTVVGHHALQHRCGIGKAGCFDQDPLIIHRSGCSAFQKIYQSPSKIGLDGTTQTSSIQTQHRIIAAGDQLMIQSDFAELVDDNGRPPERRIAQDAAYQRRFAASQKAGDDRDRDQTLGTAIAGGFNPNWRAVSQIAAQVATCSGIPLRRRSSRVRVSGSPGISTSPPASAGREAFT